MPHYAEPTFAHILPPSWKEQVIGWLKEDTPSFDWGGYVVGEVHREAYLFGKGKIPAVLAGVPFCDEVFRYLGCHVEWHMCEGDIFEPIKHVATVSGPARQLLLGERVALNLLARCSGIATKSRRFKAIADENGFRGIIAGTRKTTPGFRLIEKYGMLVGGIDGHRTDLSSMVMLKDNHIWSSGSITRAIQQTRRVSGFSVLIDVEGRELLDVAQGLKERWSGKRKFLLETSGGIEESNLRSRAVNPIDILSTSAVHQTVQHIDFSLKIQIPKPIVERA
ncbi:nicotinate-nucleotide diphosphorylase [Cantharellus anzutake]|uniref:nicotinate-nucleotide diphosphorylase n=1 Tax=Cantharellus anzutake TaxID=1750568 RepID=UPI00190625E1|nr:nicotinate-nucleotide diphosphorylase [Cantharellus anzutake]KAF8325198.1 nicotinate-nucleotide diphosphorylase [Cantharellus anzutake]